MFSSPSCNLMFLILRAIATSERRLTHVTVCPQSTYNNLLVSLESLVVPPTPQMVQASAECCLRPADDSRASRYNIVGLAETRDLNKGGFPSSFSRKYASTCGVFKSFLLIQTKKLKRCKYDSASCRACVV